MPKNIRDLFDGFLRQPVIVLFLSLPQGRDHGGGLTPLRIFGDLLVQPRHVFGRELETVRLLLGETAGAHDFFPLDSRMSWMTT